MSSANTLVMPRAVAWLGYGGLVPFVLLAAASLLDPPRATLWREALTAYGAVILAFVGALHWGLAMGLPGLSEAQRSACFAWSVVPALMAWPALLLAPVPASLLLAAGLVAHCVQDWRLARRVSLPDWYLPLRWRLSGVAVTGLVAGGLLSSMQGV